MREGHGLKSVENGNMTRKNYLSELETLSMALSQMAVLVDGLIGQSIQALAYGNTEMAEIMLRNAEAVDLSEIEIEKLCLKIIALQQPVGRDLRLISGALTIAMDLQRIGDHGRKIARITRELPRSGAGRVPGELLEVGDTLRRILGVVVDVLETHEVDASGAVTAGALEMEGALARLQDIAHAAMTRGASEGVTASYLLFAAHHLAEAAELAVDITARIAYAMTGKSVRALPAR